MSKSITVSLSDGEYAALQTVSAQTQQSPEELIIGAIATLTQQSGNTSQAPVSAQDAQQAKRALLAVMRARGHLVEPVQLSPHPGADNLPPIGSPERAQFEDKLGDALSDALERSGKSILDLIER